MISSKDTDVQSARAYEPRRVLSYEAYLDRERQALEACRVEIDEAALRYAEAAKAYQASLRSLPPMQREHYESDLVAGAAHAASHAMLAPEPEVKDELTGHNYDGIQEYDNPAPGWWHMLFIGTAVWAVFYLAIYHFSPYVGSLPDRHASAVAQAEQAQFAELATLPLGEEKILKIMGSETWLASGRGVYEATCVQCHGENGGGLNGLGQNLTDESFKYITDLTSIATIVHDGLPPLMPPKAGRPDMSENEIALVAAYVASLRGTFVDGGREPEGVEIAPWPEPPAEDGA